MTLWKVQLERARQHDRGWVPPHERGDSRFTAVFTLPNGIITERQAKDYLVNKYPKGHRILKARPWKEAA